MIMKENFKTKNGLCRIYMESPSLMKYFFNSCFSMCVDVLLVWLFYMVLKLPVVFSNTIGVVCGFIVSYVLTARFVFFNAKGRRGFSVFFVTFLVGLVLADWLIYMGEYVFFTQYEAGLRFFLSKGLSIVIPFFFLYFLRKYLYAYLGRHIGHKES